MPAVSFAEALAVAVRIEENGIAFYEEASRQSADPSAMDVFRKLAAMEKEHRSFFLELAKTADDLESRFANDPQNSFAGTLSAMADGAVFDAEAGTFTGKERPGEAVRAAIALEKDSIIFYLGLKSAMAESKERIRIDGIICEEMRHISILHELLKKQR